VTLLTGGLHGRVERLLEGVAANAGHKMRTLPTATLADLMAGREAGVGGVRGAAVVLRVRHGPADLHARAAHRRELGHPVHSSTPRSTISKAQKPSSMCDTDTPTRPRCRA
jgi:hypothetical protein